jgi:hypothetical protein
VGTERKEGRAHGCVDIQPRQSEQMRADVSQRMSGSNERAHIFYEERRIEPNRGRWRERADRIPSND